MAVDIGTRRKNADPDSLKGIQAFLVAISWRDKPVLKWVFAATAIALAFWVRYELDHQLPGGFPYLTFFPAVIITTFLAGTAPGALVGILGGLAAWYFFIPPFDSFGLTGGSLLALAFYVFIVAVDIALIHWMHVALDRLTIEKEATARYANERDLLFRELQHRVSNNLAVVSALLNTQARVSSSAEATAALQQASARIGLVSKIQRQLHDPSRQSLDMAPYLSQLGADLLAASGVTGVTYETEVAPTEVDAETAVPLALIVTELISNAIEHGCADGRPGTIRVTLQREGKQGNTLRLQVADDGPGWPEGFSIAESRNLGMRIVGSLTQQIGGSFEASNDGGAVATLVFEARPAFAPQPEA